MVAENFFKGQFCLFFYFKSIYVMNRPDPARPSPTRPARPDRGATLTRFWQFITPKVKKIGTSNFLHV